MKRRSGLLDFLEFWSLRGVLFGVRVLPLSWAYRLVEWMIVLAYAIVPTYRRRARESIAIALGDRLDEHQRRELMRTSLRYHAWFWVDVLLAPRLLQDPRLAGRVDVGEVDRALRGLGESAKRGVLLVASHQGTPDLGSLAVAQAGWAHSAVARPPDNRRLSKILVEERRAFPRTLIPKSGALRFAHRLLAKGEIVAVQIDQDAGPLGVFVPYFGRLASTHPGAALLATLTGAPVLLLFCLRTEAREFRYRMLCRGPFHSAQSGDRDADVLQLTTRMTAEIEAVARDYPEQVLWAHRRWKTRPEDA